MKKEKLKDWLDIPEEKIHIMVCNFIKAKYPQLIFLSDGSGLPLPNGLAAKFAKMKSEPAIPDLHILEPRKGYHGLIIEIKKLSATVYLKKGGVTKNQHIRDQLNMLSRLNDKGYKACMCIGYKETIKAINDYMK